MNKSNWFLIVVVFATFCIGTLTLNSFAQYTKLYEFAGTDGKYPACSLISDSTFLYGTTVQGGTYNYGTIFKIKPDGTGYSKLLDFTDVANGKEPMASLFYDGTYLYGTTMRGGANTYGTIFKILPDGSGYVKLLDFTNLNGSTAAGSLISDGTYLYGMTVTGGTNGCGVIYKIMPDGTNFSKILDFTGASNGSDPWGSLFYDGTYMYGMTQKGGASNMGVIFKILPNGTGYSKLFDFTGTTNGKWPQSGSLVFDGNFLYGMTRLGGLLDSGLIFKIKPDGTGYTKLMDFTGVTTGSIPFGDLILDGNNLYGMTKKGGITNNGVVFKIKPDGTGYSKLLDFDGPTNGSDPQGGFFFDGDFLYGMTFWGGVNYQGVIFKYKDTTLTSITNDNISTMFKVYPNPSSGNFAITQIDNLKSIEVLNILGEKIEYNLRYNYHNTTEIDISNVPKGIYFVKFDNGEEVYIEKVVLN